MLEMWYCGVLCEMESSWIGKCEVDVSKVPRFPRQRICKVCMVHGVRHLHEHLYLKWNIIRLMKDWEMVGNERVESGWRVQIWGKRGFTTPVIPFLFLRPILEGGLS